MTQAREQARSAFLFGMDGDGLDEAGLNMLAGDAWAVYQSRIAFDYPRYAHSLFLAAYRMAYHTFLRNLAGGQGTDVAALESEILAEHAGAVLHSRREH